MYYLNVSYKLDALKNLEQDELFQRVCTCLQTPKTLREIKQVIPELTRNDRRIEYWIKNKLILRNQGSYSLNIPILSISDQERIKILTQESFEVLKHEIITNYNLNFLSHFLLATQNELPELTIYFTETAISPTYYPVYFQHMRGTKEDWYSFEMLGMKQLTLPSYFYGVANPKYVVPAEYHQIEDSLGDVNPAYFLNYSEKKLRRVRKGRVKKTETLDLFLNTLEQMNYLENTSDIWCSKIHMFDKDTYNNCVEMVNVIKDKLSQAEIVYSSQEIRIYFFDWLNKNDLAPMTPYPIYLNKLNQA